jgi:hypothetical protein
MKLSVSVSDGIGGRLVDLAKRVAGGNVSLLAEVAFKRIFDLAEADLVHLAAFQRLDRRAATRSGWMRAFWRVLGDLMGQPDAIDNPYAPRTFEGFYVVLLLRHVGRPDEDEDPFIPYVGPAPVTPESPSPIQFYYERSASPVAAAQSIAAKLRQFGVRGASS